MIHKVFICAKQEIYKSLSIGCVRNNTEKIDERIVRVKREYFGRKETYNLGSCLSIFILGIKKTISIKMVWS